MHPYTYEKKEPYRDTLQEKIGFHSKADFHNAINSIRDNGILNTIQIKAMLLAANRVELVMPF